MPYPKVAPPFFCTAFIEDSVDAEGWTESYWLGTAGATYDTVLASFQLLMQARMALTTPEIVAKFIRVSNASVFGDTKVFRWTGEGYAGTYPAMDPTAKSLPSDDSIFLRTEGMSGAVPYHAVRPLHALPRLLVSEDHDRVFEPDAEWLTNRGLFSAALEADGYMVHRIHGEPADEAHLIVVPIESVTYSSNIRDRKVGRPFGLLRGRAVPR